MEPIRHLKVKLFVMAIVVSAVIPLHVAGGENESIRLNPEYKINRNSNGTVTITSKKPESKVRHEFNDFYADLLMAAYRKQSLNAITDMLMRKYYLSEDECRRELKHAINILAEWRIILRNEDLTML